jgi:putative transposase
MSEILHILSRGVDKRKIFLDGQDYVRFIHDLYEFNDEEKVNNAKYYFNKQYKDIRYPYIQKERKQRKLIVDVHAFCLMPNHYHIMASPRLENAIPLFMRKVNGGYSRYFNRRHKRKGSLFESKYKSIPITQESHFIHLPYYIHLNPLDLVSPEWRDRKLKDRKKAQDFLEQYRWSSHLDYAGKKNFPSVTQRETLTEFFEGHKSYKKDIDNWLKSVDLKDMKEEMLE